MITTRRATLEDLPTIVEVNKSDVNAWYHWSKQGMGTRTTYKELTGWSDRCMGDHGFTFKHFKGTGASWKN